MIRKQHKLREVVRKASGESIDLKAYEADMRHLIDLFVEAEASKSIALFDNLSLLDLIVKSGIGSAIASLPGGIKSNQEATTETIANNIRHTILKDHLNDPAYYDKMSQLLGEIIKDLKAQRLSYQEYLNKIAALAKQVQAGYAETVPAALNTPELRALYSNLREDPAKAIAVDKAVKAKRPDGWRGEHSKEQVIKKAIWDALKDEDKVAPDDAEVERLFRIIKQHEGY